MVDDRPRRRRPSLVARLLRPFSAVWRFLMVNTPLGMLFRRRPVSRARRPLGRRLSRPFVAAWRLSAWMGRILVVRPAAAVGDFLGRWLRTRAAQNLWKGLPAVAVGSIAVIIVWLGWATRDFDLVRRYEGAAWEAFREEDLDAADVYFQKLSYLDADEPRIQYGMALTVMAQGDEERAMRLMKRLAPDDKAGYPPAHYWIARQLAKGEEEKTPAEWNQLLYHLQQVIAHQKESTQTHEMLVDAHAMLSQIMLANGRADLAAEHLVKVVDDRPPMRLQLVRVYQALGKQELASFQAETAAKRFARLVQRDPNDVEARLYWSQAQAFLGNWGDAAKMLLDGFQKSGDERYRASLARLYIARSDELRLAGKGTIDYHVNLLQQALAFAPNDPNVAARLAGFATVSGTNSEKLTAALNDILASGKASATVHLILGTAATRDGDMAKARLHLEQANRLSAKSPEILNNLAWVLAHFDPPEFEHAEQLAAEAVQLAPTNGSIRETHGQILAQLDRPQEAIAELEFALRSPDAPNRRAIHETLAAMYRKLGADDLAEAHIRLAEQEPKVAGAAPLVEPAPGFRPASVIEPPSDIKPPSEVAPPSEIESGPAVEGGAGAEKGADEAVAPLLLDQDPVPSTEPAPATEGDAP